MANSEVSRLKFNNTTYDIADELARQNIGTARTEIATEAARLDAVDTALAGRITNLENSAGAVLVAKTKSAMSNTSKIYVYTGSESGMTRGNWYYHNGSAWVSGGAYNQNLDAIDATLTQSNKGADAKVTGDRLTAAETDISTLRGTIANEYASQAYAVGDYCYHNGLLYRCNTEISVGETWTSGHWTAVDVMPELNNLKNDLSSVKLLNSYNLLNSSTLPDTGSNYGLSFKYDRSKNEITITGNKTSGQVSSYTYFIDQNSLPKGMKAGETYYVSYDGADSFLYIWNYVSPQSLSELMKLKSGKNVPLTIPADCTGLIIRSWIGRDVSGEVNEICHPIITDSLSNQAITDLIYSDGKALPLKYIKTYTGGDANEFKERGYTFVSYQSGASSNWTNMPTGGAGWLINLGPNDGYEYYAQIFIKYNTSVSTTSSYSCETYFRHKTPDGWEPWSGYANTRNLFVSPNYLDNDADNLSGKLTFVSSTGGQTNLTNIPYEKAQFLLDLALSNVSNIHIQFSFPYYTDEKIYYRIRDNSKTWSSWVMLDTGGTTTTITQEVSRDTYNNTYNITTSPQITTDTNGWLRAVDTNTADESNKTDMTGPIMSMLNSTGYCHLGPGIFYVSGGIDMPADSMIEGCGKQTIIRLLQSTTSGYIVRMHTRSTLKNVCFSGGYNIGSISNGNIGGRKGINYIGNRDGQNPEVTPSNCTLCMIEGCWFENLDSGIYGYNAGGGLQNGLEVSNCFFTRCKAGINLDYWVEYSKFTNCVTFQCYYACINNGGNNVFTACTFHGVIGFLIDNSANNKTNNAHGSCVGCTFNHIDNMNNPSELGKGIGIKVLNTVAGFLFANCQIWYGRIHIESSKGIQITGCEIGGLGGSEYPVLETSGDYMVFVDNCLFQNNPTKSTSSPTKFTNCWTYDGASVT